MCKGLIIMVIILIGALGVFLSLNPLLLLGIVCLILFSYIVLSAIFVFQRKNKILKKFKTSYDLEVLENVSDNDIYVLKNYTSNGKTYLFSYVDENGKKVICSKSNVEYMQTSRKPYVEIFENIYKPKGVLDFLFYSKEIEELYSTIYVLYVNESKIKLIN